MVSKKRRVKNKKSPYEIYYWLTGIVVVISFLFFVRSSLIMYYYMAKGRMEKREYGYAKLERKRSDQEFFKIETVLQRYDNKVFGLDISQHQGDIQWGSIGLVNKNIPITFIFMRATRGGNVQDVFFKRNWKKVKQKNIIRGAYHYYDVNKNSTIQATHFINTVSLSKGDLPPVLDVEELPRDQSLELLKKGILNWIRLIEEHYKVKPIIYSNDAYFIHHIPDLNLEGYIIWVANYNPIEKPLHGSWVFWQFSENGIVKGITENFVDLNVFNGDKKKLQVLTLK